MRLLVAAAAAGCAQGAFAALPQDIELDDASSLRRAIESGAANPNTRVVAAGYGEPGIPIVALAARNGSIKVIRLLVSLKADLDAKTPVGETAVMLASFVPDPPPPGGGPDPATQLEVVRVLVEAGASLQNPGQLTAAAYAAYAGQVEILRYLLDRGASPDGGATGEEHRIPTPLMMAVMKGNRDAVLLLLERGANPRIRGPAGIDAVGFAQKMNRTALVPMLECAARLAAGQRFADACPRR